MIERSYDAEFNAQDEHGLDGPAKLRLHAPECGWCKEAASEIERLRAEVAALKAAMSCLLGHVERARGDG